jgi:hypothetical protein
MATATRSFFAGLGAGALGALAAGVALSVWVAPAPGGGDLTGRLWEWAWRNLGLSLPVFGVVLLLFLRSLARLHAALESARPIEEVAQLEHVSETWTSLFFGVGVIWTAIGLRQALIYALGDPVATMAAGAFEVLRRLVEGGILVALSTTIFGGVGGYLMRVAKTLSLGAALRRYYGQAALAPTLELKAAVERIEAQLARSAVGQEDRA